MSLVHKNKESVLTIIIAAELTEVWPCCLLAPYRRGSSRQYYCVCGKQKAFFWTVHLYFMGNIPNVLHVDTLDKGIAQWSSHLHILVIKMTHCCIQHLLRYYVASRSPVSLQSVSKVTVFSTVHCTRPRSPASFAYRLMDALPFALVVLNLANVTPFSACILSLEERNGIFFFFNICVLWSCPGVTYEKWFFCMCLFGILRDYLLGYLMYISLYPVAFLCCLGVLQFFLGGGSAVERAACSSLFPCPSVAMFWFEYLPKLVDPCWL